MLEWVEQRLWFKFVGQRGQAFEVLSQQHLTAPDARCLADAADALWNALLAKDAPAFGRAMTEGFEAQCAMFPLMRSQDIDRAIDAGRDFTLGHKISGAGGGGYVVFFSETPVDGAIRAKIRREE